MKEKALRVSSRDGRRPNGHLTYVKTSTGFYGFRLRSFARPSVTISTKQNR